MKAYNKFDDLGPIFETVYFQFRIEKENIIIGFQLPELLLLPNLISNRQFGFLDRI